jgi:hypothetical protein
MSTLPKPWRAQRIGSDKQGAFQVALFKRAIHGGAASAVEFNLGHYQWQDNARLVNFKRPCCDDPKSEVRLPSLATLELVKFLLVAFPELAHGVTFEDLSQYRGDQRPVFDLALKYIKAGAVPADLDVAIEIARRRQALTEFEQRLGEDWSEPSWQAWFKGRNWIVGGQSVVLQERDIDVDHQTDFLLKDSDGFMDIVEIKRPDTQFWEVALHRNKWYVPSSEVTKSITQATNYALRAEKRLADSVVELERVEAAVARPNVLIVLGRSHDWDSTKFQAQRLLNSSLHGIRVITYDQLLTQARQSMPTEGIAERTPY